MPALGRIALACLVTFSGFNEASAVVAGGMVVHHLGAHQSAKANAGYFAQTFGALSSGTSQQAALTGSPGGSSFNVAWLIAGTIVLKGSDLCGCGNTGYISKVPALQPSWSIAEMALTQGRTGLVGAKAIHRRRTCGLLLLGACAVCALCLPVPSFVLPPRSTDTSASRYDSKEVEQRPVGDASAATRQLLPVAAAAQAAMLMEPAAHAQGIEFALAPLGIINFGLDIFKLFLGTYAIMSWLFIFGILDMRQEIVGKVQGFLSSVIEPVLAPLRAVIPPLAGIDISFILLWFVIDQAQVAAKVLMIGMLDYYE